MGGIVAIWFTDILNNSNNYILLPYKDFTDSQLATCQHILTYIYYYHIQNGVCYGAVILSLLIINFEIVTKLLNFIKFLTIITLGNVLFGSFIAIYSYTNDCIDIYNNQLEYINDVFFVNYGICMFIACVIFIELINIKHNNMMELTNYNHINDSNDSDLPKYNDLETPPSYQNIYPSYQLLNIVN